MRRSSPVTAAGPRRIHTVFPCPSKWTPVDVLIYYAFALRRQEEIGEVRLGETPEDRQYPSQGHERRRSRILSDQLLHSSVLVLIEGNKTASDLSHHTDKGVLHRHIKRPEDRISVV